MGDVVEMPRAQEGAEIKEQAEPALQDRRQAIPAQGRPPMTGELPGAQKKGLSTTWKIGLGLGGLVLVGGIIGAFFYFRNKPEPKKRRRPALVAGSPPAKKKSRGKKRGKAATRSRKKRQAVPARAPVAYDLAGGDDGWELDED